MIRKSGNRFFEKIMTNQEVKARWRFDLKSSRFSGPILLSTAAGIGVLAIAATISPNRVKIEPWMKL
jgi:hypothetical protein